MVALVVIPDLEVRGFRDGDYPVREHTGSVTIGGLARGTAADKPTVLIGLDDGDVVLVAETTLALFLTAADALKAKYGDPREDSP